MSQDAPKKKQEKPNFPQGDIDKAVNYHVLDKKLPKKDQPPYCQRESDPKKGKLVFTKCGYRPQPVNCALCNPHGKI
jgi:hypothetical protein